MKRVAVVALAALMLVSCGGDPETPNTEGQTLAEAQRNLADAGVAGENVQVVGAQGDPERLIVCDQNPIGEAPTESVTLDVAHACPQPQE